MVEFPDHPFWDFSLATYMNDVVPPACLAIQERYTLDVNCVLLCCWMGASGRGALSVEDMDRICGTVAAWNREIVCGLRTIRTALKGGFPGAPDALAEGVRKTIAKTEIDCEHVEQLMLAGAVDRAVDEGRPLAARAEDCMRNIRLYLGALGVEAVEEEMRAPFGVILARVFPDLSGDEISDLTGGLAA